MKSGNYKTFICDFETLSAPPNCIVLSGAFLVFDIEKNIPFDELVKDALFVKFDVKEQKAMGRRTDQYTLEWWKKQSKEAQKHILPSKNDISIKEGVDQIQTYLYERGIRNPRKTLGFARGTSFDLPILEELYEAAGRRNELPVEWYNYRDIRTYIGTMIGEAHKHSVPLSKNVINGFVAHDCRHDIAKDVIMMQYSEKYAFGEEEVPNEPQDI